MSCVWFELLLFHILTFIRHAKTTKWSPNNHKQTKNKPKIPTIQQQTIFGTCNAVFHCQTLREKDLMELAFSCFGHVSGHVSVMSRLKLDDGWEFETAKIKTWEHFWGQHQRNNLVKKIRSCITVHATELPCHQQTDWTTIAIPHQLARFWCVGLFLASKQPRCRKDA